MEMIRYFESENQAALREKLVAVDWSAAKFLVELLETGRFFEMLGGWGDIYLLMDGEELVSFATLTGQDAVRDESLTPWIGFVYTRPEYRGHRYAGQVLAHAEAVAAEKGYGGVYIATDHVGLYEKYGYAYQENRVDFWGSDQRVLYKSLRTIKAMEEKYLQPSLDLIQTVFTEYADEAEGKMVRSLVEEIRGMDTYVPELELVMVDAADMPIGYVMFSRFHLEGKYRDELLILTPVGVKTALQRQHISKALIEYGFEKAKELGCRAVIVEGDPRNYNPRGFVTAANHGILPGKTVHLPAIECLMVKELVPGALDTIHGIVDYSDYQSLT